MVAVVLVGGLSCVILCAPGAGSFVGNVTRNAGSLTLLAVALQE